MPTDAMNSGVSVLLERYRSGDVTAFDELMGLLYGELRRLAAYQLRAERPGHTLQPTALVHEAYLRLVKARGLEVTDRVHFLALAAHVMRNILVDHARARKSSKRAGIDAQVGLDEALAVAEAQDVDIEDLNAALDDLTVVDPDLCRIVELRCFAGLTVPEVAEVLGVSHATVNREWAAARAWLRHRLTNS